MPITNRQAFDLKRDGKTVPVVCENCDETVWSKDAVYDEGNDEWACSDCHTSPGGD